MEFKNFVSIHNIQVNLSSILCIELNEYEKSINIVGKRGVVNITELGFTSTQFDDFISDLLDYNSDGVTYKHPNITIVYDSDNLIYTIINTDFIVMRMGNELILDALDWEQNNMICKHVTFDKVLRIK